MTTLYHFDSENQDKSSIASSVEFADSIWSRARGRMFTTSIDRDEALIFEFNRQIPRKTSIWMGFVPYRLGVVWLDNDVVTEITGESPRL